MKKHFTLMSFLIILVIFLLIIEYFPYGIKNYKVKKGNIKIPKMIYKVKSTNNTLVFKSFRDSHILNKDIKKILKEYKIIKENKKIYYYDIKQNITIKKYVVEKGFMVNKIIIEYK